MIFHIFSLILAYVIGSIPTGYWLAKLLYDVDIRQHGSGNTGATNVGRILGKKYFFLVMMIDACKAYAFLVMVNRYGLNETWYLLCIAGCLLIGNAHSLFLNFQGGKGVATALGILSFFLPFWMIIFFSVFWGLVFFLTTFAFLASLITMFVVFTVYVICFGTTLFTFFLIVLFIWLLLRHHSNITVFLKR